MDRLRPVLLALGYSAWFGLLFVVFTWITFPWGKVADQLTVAAADRGVAFQATKLRPAIVGASAKGLIIGSLGGEETAPWLQAESLKARTGLSGGLGALMEVRAISAAGGAANTTDLVKRLLGALGEVSVTGDLYGADLDLSLADEQGEAMRLALATGRFDLSAYPIQSDSFAASPTGRLKADADVLWHWEDPKKSSGTIDLTFDHLHLTGFKVSGFALPETTFDRAEAHLKLGKGRAEFRNTAFESEVVEAQIEGFINLRKDIQRSTLALRVKFKVREDLEGLLSMAGLRKDSRNRDQDGWFHYEVQGRLLKPRFKERRVNRPSSRQTKPTPASLEEVDEPEEKRRKPTRPPPASSDNEPISRGEMTDERKTEIEEERQRLREERLKRREERRKKREELMQQRQERVNVPEDEDEEEDVPTSVTPPIQRPDLEDFDRTNDVDVEGEDDPQEDENEPDAEPDGEEFEE